MTVRIEDIRAFLRTAHVKSFRGAAADLNITQPALSQRLQKLEADLGAKLFDRTSRTVHLTSIGVEFLPTAKRILLEFDNSLVSIRDVIQKRAGSIVVASNMTIANTALPAMIRRFSESHGNIQVSTMEDNTPTVISAVASGEADFGIASSASRREGIEFIPLVDDEVVLVAYPEHALAKKKRVKWTDIKQGEFISMRRATGTRNLLNNVMEELGILHYSKYRASHVTTVVSLVHAGLGISALPRLAATCRPELNLVYRELVDPKISRKIGIVRRAGRTLSPNAMAFCDLVGPTLNEFCKSVDENIQPRRRKRGNQSS